jgi:uncharacterized membrane protein YfcA
MHWQEAVGLVLLGLFAGGYGTMVGLGGGFLLVPAFLLLGFDSRVAAGTSLAVVFANGVSGTISYLRQKRVDVATAVIFAVAGIPGAWLGAVVDQWIPQRLFSVLFAALLAWIGIRLLTTGPSSDAEVDPNALREDEPRPGLAPAFHGGYVSRDFVDARGVRHMYRYNVAAGTFVSLFAGFVASTFGIGGGIVQVPAMVFLFGFPAHIATATSHMIIAVTALFGTASHALYGDVRWTEALLVSVGAVVGAQVGARVAHRVKAAPLMRLLSVAVLVTAAKLLWNAL